MVIPYKNLSREAYIKKFLDIINCIQIDPKNRMVGTELDLLCAFLMLPKDLSSYRFSKLSKDIVTNNMLKRGWKLSRANLNNKLYDLIDKGILVRQVDRTIVLAKFIELAFNKYETALENGKPYEFKLRFEIE